MAVMSFLFLVFPSSRLPTSISSKRSKEEVFRGPQSLPSFRQQKNGHPISWETIRLGDFEQKVIELWRYVCIFIQFSISFARALAWCWGEKFSKLNVLAKMGSNFFFAWCPTSSCLFSGYQINGGLFSYRLPK